MRSGHSGSPWPRQSHACRDDSLERVGGGSGVPKRCVVGSRARARGGANAGPEGLQGGGLKATGIKVLWGVFLRWCLGQKMSRCHEISRWRRLRRALIVGSMQSLSSAPPRPLQRPTADPAGSRGFLRRSSSPPEIA